MICSNLQPWSSKQDQMTHIKQDQIPHMCEDMYIIKLINDMCDPSLPPNMWNDVVLKERMWLNYKQTMIKCECLQICEGTLEEKASIPHMWPYNASKYVSMRKWG